MRLFNVDFNAFFYLVEESCDVLSSSCIDYQVVPIVKDGDGNWLPSEMEAAIIASLTAGTVYYVIVDGYTDDSDYGGVGGPYSIEISLQ